MISWIAQIEFSHCPTSCTSGIDGTSVITVINISIHESWASNFHLLDGIKFSRISSVILSVGHSSYDSSGKFHFESWFANNWSKIVFLCRSACYGQSLITVREALNAKYRRTKSPDKNAGVFKISADFSAIIFIIIYFLSPILRKIILILISLRDFLNYKFNSENFNLRRFELKKLILNSKS